jgi:hypothetical protein
MPKLKNHQVGQAGEHFVAAELHRRGAHAVTFSGNMPAIDVLASDVDQTRTVAIQVKTKTAGTWQTTTRRAAPRPEKPDDARFWILVDIGKDSELPPAYFVVPEWWIRNYIYEGFREYLAQHGGARPNAPESTHYSLKPADMEEWRGRWDLLGICLSDE